MEDEKSASTSSNDNPLVSGTKTVDQTYAAPHAEDKSANVRMGEYSIKAGVTRPTRKLLNQFDAVDIDVPLLRMRPEGNTSLAKTQAIGPILVPYDAVNM